MGQTTWRDKGPYKAVSREKCPVLGWPRGLKKNLWRILGFLEVKRKGAGANFIINRIDRMGGRVSEWK